MQLTFHAPCIKLYTTSGCYRSEMPINSFIVLRLEKTCWRPRFQPVASFNSYHSDVLIKQVKPNNNTFPPKTNGKEQLRRRDGYGVQCWIFVDLSMISEVFDKWSNGTSTSIYAPIADKLSLYTNHFINNYQKKKVLVKLVKVYGKRLLELIIVQF